MASVMMGRVMARAVQAVVGLVVLMRVMAMMAPRKVLPESPMNILAGAQLKYRKLMRAVLSR
jgi:hypothetical protein